MKTPMTTTRVLTRGFLSMMAAIGLFAASHAFAEMHRGTSQSDVGPIMAVSGDQRIVELASPHSSAGCIVDSMVLGDQRMPERQIAGSEGSGILSPVKTDDCTGHDYMMPMNR